MDKGRRTFLTHAVLASSALAAAKTISAQGPGGYRRIAVEETFTIPEVLDALRELVARDPDREPGLTAPPDVVTDTVRVLYDLDEGRITAMHAARIDKQVLSLWSPGVQVFDAELGTELARLVNDRLAERSASIPTDLLDLPRWRLKM